jgi:hypothetical protein
MARLVGNAAGMALGVRLDGTVCVCVWMDVGAGRLRIVVGLDRKKHVAVESA